MTKQRRSFSPEFKRNAAALVLDQSYSHMDACRSVGVAESVLRRWIDQLQLERRGATPQSKALTPEQQRIQEIEARIDRLEREKAILKKSHRALNVGRGRTYALIEQLAKGESIALLCALFELPRSCLYAYHQRRQRVDPIRMSQRRRVHELFVESRSSAGSRSIVGMMRVQGIAIGRFKVSRLMAELGLICKQPGSHAYKRATIERVDIPNRLNRHFVADGPNRVWCGDITYVWAQGRWHYLAAVLDLSTHRVVGWAFSTRPDADLVVQALDMAYEQRGRPQGLQFHSDQGGQYGSRKFRQRLWRYRIEQSTSRRGNC